MKCATCERALKAQNSLLGVSTVIRQRSPVGASPTRRPLQPEAIRAVIRHARQHCLTCCDAQPVAAEGPACVKTKSDLVVMPSEGRICAFFCSERDHKPQNSGCGYTAQSFHTAWTHSGHRVCTAAAEIMLICAEAISNP